MKYTERSPGEKLQTNQPHLHLGLGLPASRTGRASVSMVEAASMWRLRASRERVQVPPLWSVQMDASWTRSHGPWITPTSSSLYPGCSYACPYICSPTSTTRRKQLGGIRITGSHPRCPLPVTHTFSAFSRSILWQVPEILGTPCQAPPAPSTGSPN